MQSRKIRVFLDTSALFAGVWSSEGGARMILKLGEAGALTILVSAQVLQEAERALQRKAEDQLPWLAVLLDISGVEITPTPEEDQVNQSLQLTGHPGDAQVLAAAWATGVDYFVTLDKQHLLGNEQLEETVPFPVGTPGDFLAWLRHRYTS